MSAHLRHHTYMSWTWQRLGFVALIATFVDGLLLLAGARHSLPAMLSPFVGVLAVTVSGEWLLALMGFEAKARLPAALVTGAAAMMMAMLAISCLLNVTAQTAFVLCTLFIALIYVVMPSARRAVGPVSPADISAALLLAALIAFFCRDIAGFFPLATGQVALPIWTDYYVHGTVIASFGDPLAVKQGNILLAHVPRPFYHYGSFMFPAALVPSSGLPGLALALAVLLPLGLLIGALGLYALLAEMAGQATALFAVLCIACLPDASFYWMQNGFYGFRWLLYTAPGSGYALGVAAMALACLLSGMRTHRQRPQALGLMLLLSVSMIRLHFFALLAPAFAGTWMLARWRTSPRRKTLLVTACMAFAFTASIAVLARHPGLRSMLQPLQYTESVLGFGPASYVRFFRGLEADMPVAVPLALLLPMLLTAALGVFLACLPLVSAAWARSGRWEDVDWLPWLLCASCALLILLAPTSLNTDASELKHRHFILLYAVVGSWTIVRAVQWISHRFRGSGKAGYLLWTASAALCLATVTWGRESQPGKPDLQHMPWATAFFGVPLAPGIAQTGSYIRAHSERGDLLVMSGAAMRGYMQSRQTELIGFADVATYLGRVELLEKQADQEAALAASRAAEVDGMVSATGWSEACHRLNRMGVRWYVEDRTDAPHWDPSHQTAAFKAGVFAVYDAGPPSQSRCGSAGI